MKAPKLLFSMILSAGVLAACKNDSNETANSTDNNTSSTGTTDDETTADPTGNPTGNPTGDPTTDTDPTTDPDTTSETSETEDSETGCNFIDCGTDSDTGPDIQCDVWAQDCPEGQKCMPWADDGGNSWNALKCTPVVDEPKQVGDPCTAEGSGISGVDDCDVGTMCWGLDAENKGFCIDFCEGSTENPSCTDSATTCAIYNDGVLILCLPKCDPLAQDCPEGDACMPPDGVGYICVTDASGDEGQVNDPCEFANACDPGLICAETTAALECNKDATGCCQPFCEIGVDVCEYEGQECLPVYEPGTELPGEENVGYCTTPM